MQGKLRRRIGQRREGPPAIVSGTIHPGLNPPEAILEDIAKPGCKTEICGESESGKTLLAVQIALYAARRGHPVLYNLPTGQSGGVQAALRTLRIPRDGQAQAQAQDRLIFSQLQEWEKLTRAAAELQALGNPLTLIDETPGMIPPRPQPGALPPTRLEIHPQGLSGQANLETGIVLYCQGKHFRVERYVLE